MFGVAKKTRFHPLTLLVLVVLIIALAYLPFDLFYFLKGRQVQFRGAVVFAYSAVFALSLCFRRRRLAVFAAFAVILLSTANVVSLLAGSPGIAIFGLTPRFQADFDANFAGAMEVYKYGGSPYGIEGKYHLPGRSVAFPFPTYALYWLCSGFGVWGSVPTGFSFTILNLIAVLAGTWGSFKLAGVSRASPKSDGVWLWLVLLFVALNSQLWGNILMGQTPTLAACFLIFGLWSASRRSMFHEAVAGLLFALGLMIKPNFAPFLLYFPIVWLRSVGHPPRANLGNHHARVFIFSVSFAILLIAATLIVPNGMRVNTYLEFLTGIVPILERAAGSKNDNSSLLGVLDGFLPKSLPAKIASGGLIAASVVFGLSYRVQSWLMWLVIPLIVSPITWPTYTGLLLPAQFAVALSRIQEEEPFDLSLLSICVGLLYVVRYHIGAIGLLMMLYLVLRLEGADRLIAEKLSPSREV